MSAPAPAALLAALARTIVGQEEVLASLVWAAIAGGHVLLEGPPGLAKTLACSALAAALDGSFRRVQFTPDLLPSDVVGTRVFDQRTGEFATIRGPVFANVLLADEINRAPAKVQSALLEAMAERQVTIGPESHALPDPFLVTATMNPLEGDGTYALPLAQLDRFLLKALVGYPSAADELAIVERRGGDAPAPVRGVASTADLLRWRAGARAVHVERRVAAYAVALVRRTREPHALIERGASPRGSLALVALARARAYVDGRDYAAPDDVRGVALAALRHRVEFGYRAAVEGTDRDAVVGALVASVPAP